MDVLMGEGTSFNYESMRARKARWAHHYHLASKEIYALLLFAGLLVAGGGVAIVWFLEVPLGWLIAGLAAPFWMIAAFGRGLRELPPQPGAQTADGMLDADVLGLLPPNPSPKQLAEAVLHVPAGQFVVARLGVGPMLAQASDQPAASAAVWQAAAAIRAQTSTPHISGATLAAALIKTLPDASQQLAALKIDEDDVISSVLWYERFHAMVTAHRNKQQDGGIGRDWSFGFTPLLNQFGLNLSEHVNVRGLMGTDLPSREATLTQIMHDLSQGARLNAAVVGPLGSGKTTLVHALAKKLMSGAQDVPEELRYRQVVALDPSSLISRARGRGELEELVQRLAYEALSAKNVILFLDDAQLFFEEGTGSVDLSNVLLPILDGGALKLVMAMDEQRWLQISQKNPALAQALNRVALPAASEDDTMRAMQDELPVFEYQNRVMYTYQALDAAYRLSSRYLADQAMPGKAVKLLESAAAFAENEIVSPRSVEQAIEQTQGIKVGTADTGEERQTLLNLEQLIHARMINQTRAVQVVSDALRRARAGVRNTSRPIGTFLFLGPTGVGKTELAKSVAAVFFGGEDRLVRLDLNEFTGEGDVQRLIADASRDQHSLTAQIGRQPFSVVLLDEIEKAHPNVLGTLLQMLDEGILRDINNREVSFRDAVIVATSNAGADKIRQHIEAGEQLEQFEKQFTDELINANIFRPEFLNRFDETVLFRPLTPDELVQVVDLILAGVNKNLAVQKVSVAVDNDAKQLLVQAGYDPRLGARPMRRVVQRVVENIVANQMLSQQAQPGTQIKVTAQDVQTMLARNPS
jgi:ATP-dependent Clp protease ATP-binding subunit ClpC